MIYCLFVVYNSFFKNSNFNWEQNDVKFILFDNSNNKTFIDYNKDFCEKYNLFYLGNGINMGLSKAYNLIIDRFLKKNDWIIIFDSDTTLGDDYLFKVKNEIKAENHFYVYTPLNYDQETGCFDSPKEIKKRFLYYTSNIKEINGGGNFMTINNGIVISKYVFEKIGKYNENIFLYFTDSYFCQNLYISNIPLGVIHHVNLCDFSFSALERKALKNKFKLMKKDAMVYYKWLYSKEMLRIKRIFHYLLFLLKRSYLCSKSFSIIYFFYFVF